MKGVKHITTTILLIVSLLMFERLLWANALSISSGGLTSQDTSADTIKVQFDISWSNSWRDSINYDAVWMFVKYSTDSGTTWSHATMKTAGTNPSGISQGTGTQIDIVVPTDKKGAFLQRSSPGTGSVSTTSVQLVWDYGQDGVSDTNAVSATTVIKIFGIEMVYIPEGGFYAGLDDGTNFDFEYGGSANNTPAVISSEAGISFGTGTTQWYDNLTTGGVYEVSESFPKGFAAFYLMKYEVTQGQYTDFLNTLTRAQQNQRVGSVIGADTIPNFFVMAARSNQPVSRRNTITAPSAGNGTTNPVVFSVSRPSRAENYTSWMDLAAYADWSALRPVSELEFVKAARGPLVPLTGEYAWGTTSNTAATTISGTEDGTETITTAGANSYYVLQATVAALSGGDASGGPLRVGIFATSATTTRAASGAGYYGNLDLTGNVYENLVTVSNSGGRNFSGTHGDGILTTTTSYEGNATNPDWPGIDTTSVNRGVTGAVGSGHRGGSLAGTLVTCPNFTLGCRESITAAISNRPINSGGRLARTAA